jgi:N utilization substance protein A
VRLAAKLVGWQIDIRSEEEMKRDIASQMEQIITAPEVKISSIEGISAGDSATLAEHGIETVEQLASATVDDLSDWLDLSVDEAQELLDMAQAITEARRAHVREQSAGVGEAAEDVEAAGEVGEGAMIEAAGEVGEGAMIEATGEVGEGAMIEATGEVGEGAMMEKSAEEAEEAKLAEAEEAEEAGEAEEEANEATVAER